MIRSQRGRQLRAVTDPPATDLDSFEELLETWQLTLRAERKSWHTQRSYLEGARAYARWSAASGLGPATALAASRYLRLRRRHRGAGLPELLISARGRTPMSYQAAYAVISRHARQAGFRLHPHVLRSHGGIEFLRRGGSPQSLMKLAGWKGAAQLQAYIAAAETELAIEEAHRIDRSL